jgi:hypothetical protein
MHKNEKRIPRTKNQAKTGNSRSPGSPPGRRPAVGGRRRSVRGAVVFCLKGPQKQKGPKEIGRKATDQLPFFFLLFSLFF